MHYNTIIRYTYTLYALFFLSLLPDMRTVSVCGMSYVARGTALMADEKNDGGEESQGGTD